MCIQISANTIKEFINKFVMVWAIGLYLPTLGWANESVKKSMEMSLSDKNGNYLGSECKPIEPQRPQLARHIWKNHKSEKCSECIRCNDELAKYPAKYEKYLTALEKWNFKNGLDADEKIFYERISEMPLGINSTKYDKGTELKILKKLAELFAKEYRIVSVNKKNKIVVFEKMQD